MLTVTGLARATEESGVDLEVRTSSGDRVLSITPERTCTGRITTLPPSDDVNVPTPSVGGHFLTPGVGICERRDAIALGQAVSEGVRPPGDLETSGRAQSSLSRGGQ